MRRFLDWTAAQTTGINARPVTSAKLHESQQQIHENQHSQQPISHQYHQQLDPDKELQILHLTKLLHEIKYHQASSSPLPSSSGSHGQRELVDKIHKTLPLFLNVFCAEYQSNIDCILTSKEKSRQSTNHGYLDRRADSVSSRKPATIQPPAMLATTMDRLPDLLPFAFTIARLFVSEVRRRASNKHAEDASIAILKYLNIDSSQISNLEPKQDAIAAKNVEEIDLQGWNLLISLDVLASSLNMQIMQLLCDASLPSTLVKCLYLFFDLPAPTRNENVGDNARDNLTQDITPNCPLVKAFTQLSIKLCSNQSGIDELIKKDDLRLLIGIASSQCLSHNKPWRKAASQILLAISCSMRANFMYLEQNMCIQNYVENMHRINSLGLADTDELIDMIRTLLDFLYNIDINNRNQCNQILPLMEQYKSSRLVDLIEELIITIDESIARDGQELNSISGSMDLPSCPPRQQTSISKEIGMRIDDYRKSGKRLIKSLTVMAKINVDSGLSPNNNLRPITMSRFEMLENFRMPKPSPKNCILNHEALRLLKMSWSKCQDSHIIEAILDVTITLFNDDRYNYFIFESHQLLVYYMTNYNLKSFTFKVKQKLFKFLEFIIIETNYIPCLEIGTIGTIIESKDCLDIDLILGLRTLISCLRFNSKFSDIFREIGLLEVVINLLIKKMQLYDSDQRGTKLEILYLLLEASQYLLAGPNNLNCVQFNESGAARHVFSCLSKPKFFHIFIPTHSSSSDDGGSNVDLTPKNDRPPLARAKSPMSRGDGAFEAHNNPSIKQLQKVAFTIIRQLILSSAGEEHLANLLGLLARNMDDLSSLKEQNKHSNDEENGSSVDQPDTELDRCDLTSLMSQEVNLRICILKSLIIVLKDSHRCRTLFRKAGGFAYIISSLVILEKSLLSSEQSVLNNRDESRWNRLNGRRIWRMIKSCLMTIVMAIRFEPANLRAFSDGMISKFIESIKKLGCFNLEVKLLTSSDDGKSIDCSVECFNIYKSIFVSPPTRDYSTITTDSIKPDAACCQLFRFLYDMSLDMGDSTAELDYQLERKDNMHMTNQDKCLLGTTKSISFDQRLSTTEVTKESDIFKRRSQLNTAPKRPPSLDLESAHVEPAILTFPCFIVSMLDLVPYCPSNELMAFVCLVIKSLFRHERNQQMLCEAGMISKFLSADLRITILDENHFLHNPISFMFEKLAKQSVSAKELRMFLRLGDPFKCKNLDKIEVTESFDETRKKLAQSIETDSLSISNVNSDFVDRKRRLVKNCIETFVCMMNDKHSKTQPPFIEFNMCNDGFSSIFMPSIAPVNAKSLPPNTSSFLTNTLDVHTNEKSGILGGLGITERQFPPSTGFTYSSWICIERFPSRSSDASHNLRLLTIYRGSAATGKEYSCFKIQISALDRALTVSTQESLLFDNDNRYDSHHDPDCNLRLWTPELLVEGKWHHIVVTMSRSLTKQSTINVFVDGSLVHSQRICYISSYVGTLDACQTNDLGQNSGCSAAAYVNAFIGSLPQLRFRLRTHWKQGPCHLIEEPLSSNLVSIIHALGPNFIGNFQSPQKLQDMLALVDTQLSLAQRHPIHHDESISHKRLVHQQSAAVTQSTHIPLTRVSSSNVGTQAAKRNQQQSHPQNQYHLAEDRILMSIDARATSLMTLSRMRRIYTRFDCRQVSRVLGLASHENSTPILLLHNTGIHLYGPSRGVGAITVGYNHIRCFVPSPTQETLFNIGGCYILLGFVAQALTLDALSISLKSIARALEQNIRLRAQMDNINGYQILSMLLWKKKSLLNSHILQLIFSIITSSTIAYANELVSIGIQQTDAFRDLICETFDLWLQTGMIELVLEFIYNLIKSPSPLGQQKAVIASSVRAKNLKCLRDMDLLPRMLRLFLEYDMRQVDAQLEPRIESLFDSKDQALERAYLQQSGDFNTKSVYFIKQTVFELLNRTPRQSDILYFGQFLASLLPSTNMEKTKSTIILRNILLKSLLQMITKNNQREVNNAMQEELVRILGFDWFMLFMSGSHLDTETITIGYLNLMILISNDVLYTSFKKKTVANGGWLKEPTFSTIEGRFNMQSLGINVGNFSGMSSKKKSIRKQVFEAPNFFLLSSCLADLVEMPRIYLMTFQTMMNLLSKLETNVLDTIGSFDKLDLDTLCDCLVGDTHHKRRLTLSSIKFTCYELVVCIIYMIKDIIQKQAQNKKLQIELNPGDKPISQNSDNYPTELVRFVMYLYNNNHEFQYYCKQSDDLIDALCAALIQVDIHAPGMIKDNLQPIEVSTSIPMTTHPASKELLELARLIILDTITSTNQIAQEIGTYEQLHAFERFLSSLSGSQEAQGELIDMLLRQVLLMIDSTSRNNSIKTIEFSDNIAQFQSLLINSITICQIVTDKIWLRELYQNHWTKVLTIIDHQMCLAEQIFKFNELLPKQNQPYAFNMQRVLNRILLFALSRPIQHISDKMIMLDLLKKIYDNRTIIILNHMHSQQSAEFFVCFVHCLIKIINENSGSTKTLDQQTSDTQPLSLIERQYGNPAASGAGYSLADDTIGPQSSSALMLVSMARKVWDAIYQSKKGVLSEAFDMPLTLPAFTLDTSLDLIQLGPDIRNTCERYWFIYTESEQRPKKRVQVKQGECSSSGSGTASSAVNLLSGRLTRVVNAASFVSRVVGATAGTMASNVNLMGERLGQNRATKKDNQPGPDQSSNSQSHGTNLVQNNQSGSTSQVAPKISENSDLFRFTKISRSEIAATFQIHLSIIMNVIESQSSQIGHHLALHKYLYDEWLDIEDEILLRERAVFGPDYGSTLDKWCLDLTEGPRRMRKKMVKNTKQFYDNYPYRADKYNPKNKSLRYRPPMSYDSYLYHMKTRELDDRLLKLNETDNNYLAPESCATPSKAQPATTLSTDDIDTLPKTAPAITEPSVLIDDRDSQNPQPHSLPSTDHYDSAKPAESSISLNINSPECSLTATIPGTNSPRRSEGDADDGDSTSFVDFSPEIEAETSSARDSENIDSLSVLRLLEKNERISHMFRCSRVQGLDTYEGLLLFGREHFYLVDGFTLLKTREIKDIDSLPPAAHDPIIPNSTPNILAHSKKTCSKFAFDSVVEVHKRRYLLQPIALEIFSSDGRNALVVFPRNIRNKVYSRLMAVSTQLTSNAHESLAGQKSTVSVEGGSGLLSNFIGETSVTQRWVRGELSNFQYLMNLNTIAGRSYNDLMQYPIFPWILADYTSEYLDLNRPTTFRDLSRPIGAQTSERLEQFKNRYADWDDNETPPYHYGTFYSSAMIVASYMVRMEPFTQHFLRLQGGHFDLADRMFHSIHDSWLSASKHNMADIKELVPEFFYLPEFLTNENKYDLGIKQNGNKLDNVKLPPWAKNDPREFIRLHRSALESEYVSAHLHEWIDLIFGYKQQGQAAVDAVNVFHHLFYEGNVDIYNTDIDPIKKNAVIGFINNFGQVPKQLFKKPHPARKVTGQTIGLGSTQILPALSTVSGCNTSRSLTKYPHMLKQTSATFKELRGPVGQIVQIDKNTIAVEQNRLLIPPEYCRYVAWGHADRSIRVGLYDSERPIFVWEGNGHMSPDEVLCATIPNGRIMITAGTESLITIWKIEKMRSISPVMNLYGHVEPVTCLASSQSYSIIVSGSRDRTAIIWDLNRFTLVRQLGVGPDDKLVHHGPISAIAINNSTGDIATCASSWLYLWTINGQLSAQIDVSRASRQHLSAPSIFNMGQHKHLLSVCFSQYNEWDLDEVIVTGCSDGTVAFLSMRYYQSPLDKVVIDNAQAGESGSTDDVELQQTGEKQQEANYSASEISTTQHENGLLSNDESKTPEPNTSISINQSDPIDLEQSCLRERSETVNSEWVKLSNSPPADALSNLDPTSQEQSSSVPKNDQIVGAITMKEPVINSGDTYIDESSRSDLSMKNCDDTSEQDTALHGRCKPYSLAPNDSGKIKFSKSDTSLFDSFVIVGETQNSECCSNIERELSRKSGERPRPQSSMDNNRANASRSNKARKRPDHNRCATNNLNNESKLLPNHCWHRELYLRSILSIENGSAPQVAVTSLSISKDHKTLFVGDAGGRTTSWTIG